MQTYLSKRSCFVLFMMIIISWGSVASAAMHFSPNFKHMTTNEAVDQMGCQQSNMLHQMNTDMQSMHVSNGEPCNNNTPLHQSHALAAIHCPDCNLTHCQNLSSSFGHAVGDLAPQLAMTVPLQFHQFAPPEPFIGHWQEILRPPKNSS